MKDKYFCVIINSHKQKNELLIW